MKLQAFWQLFAESISWPPGSPTLSLLEFYFWGYFKDCACSEKIEQYRRPESQNYEGESVSRLQMGIKRKTRYSNL
jgi:hypothetical protein